MCKNNTHFYSENEDSSSEDVPSESELSSSVLDTSSEEESSEELSSASVISSESVIRPHKCQECGDRFKSQNRTRSCKTFQKAQIPSTKKSKGFREKTWKCAAAGSRSKKKENGLQKISGPNS